MSNVPWITSVLGFSICDASLPSLILIVKM